MLVDFFFKLRSCGLPVTLRELLDLLAALDARVIHGSLDDFYALSRLCLVKDETQYDRFDLAFRDFFEGVQGLAEILGDVPYEWLRKEAERLLTDAEKEQIKSSALTKPGFSRAGPARSGRRASRLQCRWKGSGCP